MTPRTRILAVARMELRDVVTRPIFWALVVAVVLATASLNPAALIPSVSGAPGAPRPWLDSPFAVAGAFALTSLLLYPFFASILAGLAVLRDDESRIGEILHATPLRPAEYLLGKFAGILAGLGAVTLLHLALAIVFFHTLPAARDDGSAGPFRPAAFLVPLVVFVLPLVLFCAGAAFAVGERTRSPLAVAAIPFVIFTGCIFFLWRWTPAWLDPRVDRLLMILDMSGLRWLSRTWLRVDRGVAFYNEGHPGLDATFLVNRLVVLAVPLLAIAWSMRRFRPLSPAPGRRRAGAHGTAGSVAGTSPAAARGLGSLGMAGRPPGLLAGAFHVARFELVELRSRPAPWLFVPLVMLMVWESAASARGPLDTPVLLTAGHLAAGAIERISVGLCLLVLFLTVESLVRDDATGLAPISHATPVRTGSILAGRQIAAGVVVAAALAGCVATGLAWLALQGRVPVEAGPLLVVWGLLLPTFVLWGAFLTAVVAAVRDRYTAYAVGIACLAATAWHLARGSMTWLTNWPLWGALRWSDMGRLDLDRAALLLNRMAMLGAAVFFYAVAARLFARTRRDRRRLAARLAPSSLLGAARRLAPLAAIPLAIGFVIAAGIRVGPQGDPARRREEGYRSANRAEWIGAPVPTLAHADLGIDLEPASRTMTVRGSFIMVNRTGIDLRRVPFTVDGSFEGVAWTIDGKEVPVEDRSGLHVLTTRDPIAPNATVRVGFSYRAIIPAGLTRNGGGIEAFVLPSGVALDTLDTSLMPLPGFREEIGRATTSASGEAEAPQRPAEFWKATLPAVGHLPEPFTARMEVSAPAGWTVNGVGVAVDRSAAGGRESVVWTTDHPVRALNLLAGRWTRRGDARVAVFHHPGHDWNAGSIETALRVSRSRYTEWFGAVPWRDLRLSEIPDHVTKARGFPTNIEFSEGIGFLARGDADVPLPFIVTAHEAAHQWWGNFVTPGEGPGADLLIEGLAHYSALLLLESEAGIRPRIGFARRLEDLYATGRRVDAERPLLRTDGERPGDGAVLEEKGAWVLWMLHNLVGRDAALAGLRDYVTRSAGNPDHPAVHDFVESLRPHAPDRVAFDTFVRQWFDEVVLPEIRIVEATLEPEGNGWLATARVVNAGSGTVTVEVAAALGERFGEQGESDRPAYRDARTTLTLFPGDPVEASWTMDFHPDRLVVDPDALVLQLNRDHATTPL